MGERVSTTSSIFHNNMFFMNGEIVGHSDRSARRPGLPSTISTGRGEEDPETTPESTLRDRHAGQQRAPMQSPNE